MINGFDIETAPLSDYEKEQILPAIKAILNGHIGPRAAITNKQIVALLSPTYKVTDSRVRKVINHIRNNDLIPCLLATSDGYFVATDEAEVTAYEESLLGREMAIKAVRVAIARQKEIKYRGAPVQGSLF